MKTHITGLIFTWTVIVLLFPIQVLWFILDRILGGREKFFDMGAYKILNTILEGAQTLQMMQDEATAHKKAKKAKSYS